MPVGRQVAEKLTPNASASRIRIGWVVIEVGSEVIWDVKGLIHPNSTSREEGLVLFLGISIVVISLVLRCSWIAAEASDDHVTGAVARGGESLNPPATRKKKRTRRFIVVGDVDRNRWKDRMATRRPKRMVSSLVIFVGSPKVETKPASRAWLHSMATSDSQISVSWKPVSRCCLLITRANFLVSPLILQVTKNIKSCLSPLLSQLGPGLLASPTRQPWRCRGG